MNKKKAWLFELVENLKSRGRGGGNTDQEGA